jgi:DNA-binding transcriptional MerR regulator
VSLSIGELAQRLRITTRAARHYGELGLLAPDQVDPRNGYRTYAEAQLVRGMQIEQLKAAGLSLANIKRVLDNEGSADGALRERRRHIEELLVDHAAQLAAIDALLAKRGELAAPELVRVPAHHVVVTCTMASPEGLSRTIRRAIQQLGRSTRQQDGVRCRSFSARFPLDVDDMELPVEVAGHLDEPTTTSTIQPAETRLKVDIVGNVALLPLAYDVVLTAVDERGLKPKGTAVEHYLDLDEVGHTEVSIPIHSA